MEKLTYSWDETFNQSEFRIQWVGDNVKYDKKGKNRVRFLDERAIWVTLSV